MAGKGKNGGNRGRIKTFIRKALLTVDEAIQFTETLHELEVGRYARMSEEVRGEMLLLTVEIDEPLWAELFESSVRDGLLSINHGGKFQPASCFA